MKRHYIKIIFKTAIASLGVLPVLSVAAFADVVVEPSDTLGKLGGQWQVAIIAGVAVIVVAVILFLILRPRGK